MKKIVEELKQIFAGKIIESEDERELLLEAADRLQSVMTECRGNYDTQTYTQITDAINNYMIDATQRRKLLQYCFDDDLPYIDPSVKKQGVQQVRLTAYAHRDDLARAYQFVEDHKRDDTFAMAVITLMNEKNLDNPDVYKPVLMKRQDFSRAISPRTRGVTKRIVWQIILGLNCTLAEADRVLASAGYKRRPSGLDLTVQYFIEHGMYDIMAINSVLSEFNIKPFTCDKSVRDSDVF